MTLLQTSPNSTCAAGCSSYEFFDPETSVVTEWSLICDKRYISALINTMYFVGFTIGYLVSGVMSDIFGRRKLIFICLYLQGLAGACIYFSNSVVIFMVLRFIQGLFVPVRCYPIHDRQSSKNLFPRDYNLLDIL